VTETPALAVVKLSESFAALWQDLAQELGVQSLIFDTEELESHERDLIAVVVAAGGEEARGLDVLLSISGARGLPIYLVGANTSHRFGVEAVRRGAADYFALPDDVDLLRRTLVSRLETANARRSGPHPKPDDTFAAIMGDSDALKATLDKARRVISHPDVTVLIGGETGTGKELLARAIHEGGPRSDGPFVAVNCAAIPASLLESELFGHVKGAFTDARTSKPGLFEEANGGTLLLDEIGHLPLELQGKLLRALDEHRIRRVGSTENREVDVRILAATHVDLEQAVARGEFRRDLFYRLNVVSLDLPPLRERGSDVELLARVFAESLARRYGMAVPRISPELLVRLRTHSWPGNVRELRHAIERSLLLSKPGTLDPAELVKEGKQKKQQTDGQFHSSMTLRELNFVAVRRTMDRLGGNKSAAARTLGISRSRLQRLLDEMDFGDSHDR
jgi:DNA-binding NtrC family response regulator